MSSYTKIHDHRLDYIRTLATLMIIMVHTWSLANIPTKQYPLLYDCYHIVCDCGVPLFVMISGALLLGGNPISVKSFFRKRYTRLFIPFIIWATIAYLLSILVGLYPIHSINSAIINFIPYLLENKVNCAYWYVPMIAMLYLITPILNRALQRTSRRTIEGYLCLGVTLIILKDIWSDIYVIHFTSELLPYLEYYTFGYYAYNYFQKKNKYSILASGTIFLIGAICYSYAFVSPVGCKVLMVMGLFICLLMLPNREYLCIKLVARCSYTIYLMHFMLIKPIYLTLHFNGANYSPFMCGIVTYGTAVAILIICTLFCLVSKRILSKSDWLGIA